MCQGRSRNCFSIIVLLIYVLSSAIRRSEGWQPPGNTNDALGSLVPELSDLPGLSIDWQAQMELLWQQHKHKVSYCIGDKLSIAADLLKRSFPLPLVTDAADPICASNATIYPHICKPPEVAVYLKFLLFTSDVEKLPSNTWCNGGHADPACAPGFFQTLASDPSDPLAPAVRQPHACCPGYFCPAMLTCMLPCPLGSYCPRAWAADPPESYLQNEPDLLLPVLDRKDKWCAPYSYKMRSGLGCGGADKWTVHPEGAFPLVWWPAGSGNLYCDGGSYCPDPVTRNTCPEGHFCKQGSSKLTACPALASCPRGTDTPQDNYLGFVLDGCLFALLAVLYNLSQLYHRIMRRLNRRERVRVMWHKMHPQVTVVEVAEEQQPPSWAKAALQTPFADQQQSSDPAAAAATSGRPAPAASRFGFLKMARRRSRKSDEGESAGGHPVWASFDEGANLPLLEYELQPEGSLELRHRHSRSSSSGMVLAANTTLQLEPFSLHPKTTTSSKAGLRAAGAAASARLSIEGGCGDFLIPAGLAHQSLSGSMSGCVVGITGCLKPLLEVGFENLSMRLKSYGKRVLQECKGHFRPWRVTAIMGPSGAGKTTLMTALAGKASYGVVTGIITINDRPDRLERHKRLMGFVPQDDVMYRSLTVEENLTYSACFRLPAATSQSQRLEVVANAIAVLGLGDVRHSLIGDEEVRGISGGQRKRVNVGIELVADPSLIFLDEPTSGLDSTASKLVVQGLKRVADSGVTVAAVIHQPSYETFSLFDDLVLLAKGGLTAYCGPQGDVQGYFEGLGFEMPEHVNPADALLDIISGTILPKSGAAVDIPACWREHQCGVAAAAAVAEGQAGAAAVVSVHSGGRSSIGGAVDFQDDEELLPEGQSLYSPKALMHHARRLLLLAFALAATAVRDAVGSATAAVQDALSNVRNAAATQLQDWAAAIAARRSSSGGSSNRPGYHRAASLTGSRKVDAGGSGRRSPPGLMRQFYWCLSRAVLMRSREPMLVFIEYMIFAITGSFLGLMSDRGRGSIADYVGNIVYNIVALGLMAMVSGIKTFGGPDRLVYYREASAGLSKLAYFWALDTWGHVGLLLRCAVYLSMYYSFSQPRAVLWQMYMVTCAIYYACTGMAYVLSQLMGPNAAQLTAAVAALINALVASKFSNSGVMGALNQISYASWGLKGYVIAEANCLTGVWLLARCADLKWMQYDINQFWQCIKILTYIGVSSRITACLGMLLLNRDKTV